MKNKFNKTLVLTFAFVLFTLLLISSCNEDTVLKPLDTPLNSSNSELPLPIPLAVKELISNLKIEAGDIKDPESYLLQKSTIGKAVKSKSAYLHFDRTALIYTYFGLAIKGSGGGGGFIDGIDILNKIPEIDIYDISSVEDDKLYIVAGGIGAPTALKDNLDALIKSIKASIDKLAKIKGKEVGGVLSVESGPANAMIAMLLSKELNLPLINADGAGRSVPSLTNLSYAHEKYSIAPTVLSSVKSPIDIEVLYPKNASDAEHLIRATISKPGFGEIGGLALWAQTGSELKASSVIKNTYSEAYMLGVFTYYAMYYNPAYLDLYYQIYGKFISSYMGVLSDFNIKTQGGFDVTTLKVKTSSGKNITIKALNEDLILNDGSTTLVTAPNLISYMVETSPNVFLPLNNGDANLMKSFIGRRIYIVNSYASRRLYDYENTFLDILKSAFSYNGPVIPYL